MIDFDMYQAGARETAIYPGRKNLIGLLYTTIGLGGESGEALNKVKKILRDSNGTISDETKEGIAGEIGDILWYCAMLCDELDLRIQLIFFLLICLKLTLNIPWSNFLFFLCLEQKILIFHLTPLIVLFLSCFLFLF